MDMDLITYALLAILLIVSLWFILKKRHNLPQIPGPPGWPVVGNAFQMSQHSPHATLKTWAEEFGDVYAINLFGHRVVVVSGEQEVREVLVHKSRDFAGRPQGFRWQYFHDCGTHFLSSTTYSARWQARKKIMVNLLRMYGDGLQHLEEVSNSIIGDMVQTWYGKGRVPFNPKEDIHYAVTNIIFSLLCGKELPTDDPLLEELVHYSSKVATEVFSPTQGVELDLLPWLRFFGHPLFEKIKDYKDRFLFNIIRGLVTDYQENLNANNEEGVLGGLLHELTMTNETTNLEGNEVMTPSIIIALVREAFAAGIQTTSSSLISLIALCTINQDFQERLRSHIRNNIGDRLPELKDRCQLPLVEATVFEVLRLTKVIPTALPHMTTKPTSIGDVSLPEAVAVWPNLWSLHHDKHYWEKPWEFNPDRFLDEDEQLVPPDHPNRKRLFSFGAGQRVCLGKSLARNRLFLFVTSLILHFHFMPVEPKPNCDPRDQILGITLYPPDYCIKIQPVE